MTDLTTTTSPIVIGGVDTHKDLHVVAVVDVHDRVIGTESFSTTRAGYRALVRWMRSFGDVARVGVECTGSYGAGLMRHLDAAGVDVLEVTAGDKADRRKRGKDDTIDAEQAAHAAYARVRTVTPRAHDGMVESLRALKIARSSAISARRVALQLIHATIISAPEELRDQLRNLTRMQLIRTLAGWRPDLSGYRDPVTATKITLKSLARRYLELHDEIADLQVPMHALVGQLAPGLLARVGIGYESATQLLITAGDNPDRLASEASFAMLCGVGTATGLLRDDHPPPAQPGRGPGRELRPAHDRHQPLADAPHHPGLRRQEEGPATLQPRDPALPQAIHRPRGLLPPAQPATSRPPAPTRGLTTPAGPPGCRQEWSGTRGGLIAAQHACWTRSRAAAGPSRAAIAQQPLRSTSMRVPSTRPP